MSFHFASLPKLESSGSGGNGVCQSPGPEGTAGQGKRFANIGKPWALGRRFLGVLFGQLPKFSSKVMLPLLGTGIWAYWGTFKGPRREEASNPTNKREIYRAFLADVLALTCTPLSLGALASFP